MTLAARVPVSFTVDARMFAGIERRAVAMGKKPADYIRMLTEAAYLARVTRERSLPASDDDLDQAVRAMFCMAGECNVATIAKATGVPESFVEKVFAGFKEFGKSARRPD